MAIPILGKRRDRRQAELQAAIDAGVEKALSYGPAQAYAPQVVGVSGATYPVPNPSSPFNQTGGNYGSNPLPRPGEDFGSLFGPGYPLWPDALDPLGPNGRTPPRRYQYQVTSNIQIGEFGAPWSMLRQIATEVDVVARCIELVQDAIAGMEWEFGFSRQIINQIRLENDEPNSARATALARDKYGEELTRVQKFWERPDERMGYTFSQWLTLAIWAQLVFDGIAVYPQYTLGGDLHSLSLLDTSTIKILLDNQGFVPRPPAPAYQQILWGFPRGEYQAEDPEPGRTPNEYRSDQLAYYIRRPRLHTVYGFSTVEECINYATLYQQRQEWMHAEWSHGATPKGVIETTGTEGWTPEQFAYFQQATNDQWSGQTQRRQQVLVMRPGMKWTQLKDMAELYNNNLDEWLVMQIGSKFGVPQQQLGIPMALHNLGSGAQNVTSMDLADKFAIDSLVNFLIDCINDLTRRFMGVGPEITITATSGNGDQSDFQRAQADASDVNNGIRTRNEVRAERGNPLISDPEADVLAVTAGNAVIFLPGQLAYQEKTEQSIEMGASTAADLNVATPSQPSQNKSPAADASGNAPAAPKSKSNVAETANRAVGHISSGTDMVSHGTDRKAKATPRKRAPIPTTASASDKGSFTEKELAAFVKFVKARQDKSYRDFEFEHVDDDNALLLNDAARFGTLEDVRDLVDIIKAASGPVAAGIACHAADTGRLLMLQRASDATDAASGDFEFPGGKLEDGESSYDAAIREWQEEVGCYLPDGEVTNTWLSPDGAYELFTYQVASEAEVPINQDVRQVSAPDGEAGELDEVAIWMEPSELNGNASLRDEVKIIPFQDIIR